MIQFDWYFSNGLNIWVAFLLVESSDPSFHLYFPLKVAFTSFVSDEGQPFFRTASFRITCCFLIVKLWTFSLPIVLRLTFTGCLGVVFVVSFLSLKICPPKPQSSNGLRRSPLHLVFWNGFWTFWTTAITMMFTQEHAQGRFRWRTSFFWKYSASSVLSFRKSPFCWLVSEVYSDCMTVHTCTCCMLWFIWVFPKIGIP